jgi:hypothetical protein
LEIECSSSRIYIPRAFMSCAVCCPRLHTITFRNAREEWPSFGLGYFGYTLHRSKSVRHLDLENSVLSTYLLPREVMIADDDYTGDNYSHDHSLHDDDFHINEADWESAFLWFIRGRLKRLNCKGTSYSPKNRNDQPLSQTMLI